MVGERGAEASACSLEEKRDGEKRAECLSGEKKRKEKRWRHQERVCSGGRVAG